ncbi:MAG: alpha/beta hydrolase, partial [Burkholderiales bacterium]|nr:alpha/beta hydrolase [Burkholderiales bacterium]
MRAEFLQLALRIGEGDQALHGSLLLPAHKQKPPVVLIIAGSGPTDRDGNSLGLPGKSNSLKMLAEELAIAGIATLRFDKRGVGESRMAGLFEVLRFQTYVTDVESWLKLLIADERFSGVAVIGHSEGSTLGMLAVQNVKVQAYIS